MAGISVSIDTRELQKAIGWSKAIVDQLPFAASQALNDMAYKTRDATRAQMVSRFTIRRPWVVNQVDVLQKANKASLTATVGPKPAASFLNLQELGGVKLPHNRFVAIPTSLVRRTKTQLISKSDKPAQLGDKVFVEQYKGNYWLALKGVKGARQRGNNSNLRFLYLLAPKADIKPRLGLHEIGMPIVQRDFQSALIQRLEAAIASAR